MDKLLLCHVPRLRLCRAIRRQKSLLSTFALAVLYPSDEQLLLCRVPRLRQCRVIGRQKKFASSTIVVKIFQIPRLRYSRRNYGAAGRILFGVCHSLPVASNLKYNLTLFSTRKQKGRLPPKSASPLVPSSKISTLGGI